jgi:adenosylcobinamide-phosphate synthase
VSTAVAVWVALLVDRLWGEPPAALHPVVAMGRYLGWAGRRLPQAPAAAFTAGALAWCAGALAVAALAAALQWAVLAWLPGWAAALLLGLALKPLLAWRMLRDEVQAVETALGHSLDAGRARLAMLVSRDVAALDAGMVRESAIESLSENLNDSVVAPLFWFLVAGLPGAALFRFANTADAMWGYRTVRGGRDWEWAGKWAARADDVLGWLPARITALLLCPVRAWAALAREAGRTASPNSGWPMAAMALRLGVRLRKPGVYALHAGGRAPVAADVARALRRAGYAVATVAALVGAQAALRLL